MAFTRRLLWRQTAGAQLSSREKLSISLPSSCSTSATRFLSNHGGQRHRGPSPQAANQVARRQVYDEVRQVLQKSKMKPKPKPKQESKPKTPAQRILASAINAKMLDDEPSAPPKPAVAPIVDKRFSTETPLKSYAEVVERSVAGKKFRNEHTAKPVSHEDAAPVEAYLRDESCIDALTTELPTLTLILQGNKTSESLASNREDLAKQLHEEVMQQRQRFLEQMGWSNEQYRIMVGGLVHIANSCAQNGLGDPALIVWRKIKEAGIINKELLQTVIHVAATFLPGNRRKRALYGKYAGGSILQILEESGENSADEDLTDICDEIAVFHDLKFEPTEQTLLVRSRLLIAQGRTHEAEDLLNHHSEHTVLHLRSFLPLLRMYIDQGELGPALRVYKKMRDTSPVHLDAETYVHLISGIAEQGGFRPLCPPIDGVTEYGFQSSSGPGLLDELVAQMKDEIIAISSALARRLYNAFADGFPESGLEKLTTLAPLRIKNVPVQDDEQVLADLVSINPQTGQCSRTGIKLRLEHLSGPQVERLKEGVLNLASSRQEQFLDEMSKYRLVEDRGEAVDRLSSFFRWLDRREGEPFTVIIDGPNVGYYMQNFETGRFSYHQIDFVIKSLEEAGERPLLIMPRKYTLDFFTVSVGTHSGIGSWKQRLTSAEKRIRTELMDSDKIAVVPSGFLDDFYWILASVSQQTNSRKGQDLSVLPNDPSGRWPGTRPVLITNDQMRDHKLGMLEPMLFRRWYSNYIVNYNFPAFVGNECSHPEIGFSPADFFSREIQCNQRSNGSNAWHFPVSDQQDVWFCLSIQQPAEGDQRDSSVVTE